MRPFDTCVGIDLARRAKHKAVVVRENGGRRVTHRRPFSFAQDRDGFFALRDFILKQTGAASLGEVAVNMEPTSGVWEALAAFLRAQGAEVFFTRTDVVAQLRKVHSKFAKTDRIDAHTLADMAWSFPQRLVPTTETPARVRRLRDLAAERQRLVEEVTRWKERMVAKLEPVWTPLLVLLEKEQRFCQLARVFFRRFIDPRKVVRLGRETFLAWCRKNAHGNTSPQLFETFWTGAVKSAQLRDMLDDGETLPLDWDTLQQLVALDLRLLATFEKEIDTLDARIKTARDDVPETDVVQQVPGFGDVLAVSVTAQLMPVARFSGTKKCSAYTGFTSRRKSSADHDIEGLKITKTGNRRLKRALALAADVAIHQDAELAAFALRLLRAGKHYNKMRVAVGRKLALRAYSLLKRYGAGQTDVAYVWRDPQGRPITKRRAKALAQKLWTDYRAEMKQKGSSPEPACSWQCEHSTQQAPNELPTTHHPRMANHKSNPKRSAGTWVKLGDNLRITHTRKTAKNP